VRWHNGAVLATGIALLVGCAPATDTLISGRFGPDDPMVLENLTIADGDYTVSYSLDVFVSTKGIPGSVSCGLVDTSGRIAFFSGMTRVVESGHWVDLNASGTFDLPELTLGLRCFAERDSTIDLVVRNVSLEATALD
jgi:hypothetical protein